MHPVRSGAQREIRRIIDDEGNVEVTANGGHQASGGELRVDREYLFSELDDVDAPAQGGGQETRHVLTHANAQVEISFRQIGHGDTLRLGSVV
jgi:hypothetical protein